MCELPSITSCSIIFTTLLFQLSPDGNVSTTTVIFIPTEADADKFLTCRAENMQLPDGQGAVEDQWKLLIHCEFGNFVTFIHHLRTWYISSYIS